MATISDLAQMDENVYSGTSSQTITNQFPGLLLTDLSQWTILDNSNAVSAESGAHFYRDGYFGVAYYNPSTGEVVIANRGTALNDGPATAFKNLASDLRLGLNGVSQPQQDAIAFAAAVAADVDNNLIKNGKTVTSIVETGHSLGGTEAEDGLIALQDNSSSYLFSAAQLSGVGFDAPGIGSVPHGQPLTAYNFVDLNAQGDAIHLAGGSHLGLTATDLVNLATGPNTAALSVALPAAVAASPVGLPALGAAALYDVVGPAHSLPTIMAFLKSTAGQAIGNYNWTSSSTSAAITGSTINTALPSLSVDSSGNLIVTDSVSNVTVTYLLASSDGQNIQATFSGSSPLAQALNQMGTVTIPLAEVGQSLTALASAPAVYENVSRTTASTVDVTLATTGGSGSPSTSAGFQVSATNSSGDFAYSVPTNGQQLIETIDNGIGSSMGSISVLGTSLGTQTLQGGSAVGGQDNLWSDARGDQYQFAPTPDSDIGTLTISGGILGSSANQIVIQNFDLNAALTSPAGYLGILLSSAPEVNAGANTGVDPPATFPAGSLQPYTFSIAAPSDIAQTVTLTLTGASPADFDAVIDGQLVPLNPDGTFTVGLAAGASSVSFGLQDVTADNDQSDIAGGTTLQLTASLLDASTNQTSTSAPLNISYLPETADTSSAPQPTSIITGQYDNDTGITTYNGDGSDDYIAATGDDNYINAPNSGSDSIVGGTATNTIIGGSGNDVIVSQGTSDSITLGNGFNTLTGSANGQETIYGTGGDNIVNANGGTDLVFAGNGTNEVYANTQTSLANAILSAQSASPTYQQGDLISVLDGNNTVVGGDGNDAITAGSGDDVIVMGPGTDLFAGGADFVDGVANWSYSVTHPNGPNTWLWQIDGAYGPQPTYTNPYPQPYYGDVVEGTTAALGVGNDTVYAGSGADYIELGNGNNEVFGGAGQDTIFGGMGNDTVIAGSGNDLVEFGGGNEYIEGGAGADTLSGGDGNNTIFGGSGNSTITSATGPTPTWAGENLEQNYVDGGAGNDVIYGSGGNDTLIAGTGNSTIYGGSGNEYIEGGSGNDELFGGSGNSTVVAGGDGADTLLGGDDTSSACVLYGGDGYDYLEGGSGSNVIYAGDGGDASTPTYVFASQSDPTAVTTIYGGLGVDSLTGGSGNTVIYAGDGGTADAPTRAYATSGNTTIYGGLGSDDIQSGSGTDVVYAGDGGTSSAPTTVLGGSGTSTLYGGAGSSLLEDGQSGSDLIISQTGDDTILGMGADTLVAGAGADVIQSNAGSVTVEINPGFGDSTVQSDGGTYNLVFGTGIGSADLAVTPVVDSNGNLDLEFDGDGGSVLAVGALEGALGTTTYLDPLTQTMDQLLLANGGDQTVAGTNGGRLIISAGNNESISAGTTNGADTISSWGTNATLTGGNYQTAIYSAGASAHISGTILTADAVGNNDNVAVSSYGYVTLSGANSEASAGLATYANLTAAGTNDTLVGGIGSNYFTVESGSDVVQASSLASSNALTTTVSFTLPTNITSMTLSGSANIAGTANSVSDSLYGGAGNDTLVAGSAADTLVAGSGNTTFVINSAADVVEDYYGVSDTLESSASFTAPSYVNTLILTGTAKLTATDNGGSDTLVSNTGADTLVGSGYYELFVVNNAADVVSVSASAPNDTMQASVSATLAANVDTLILSGTSALKGTANADNDTLISNSGADTLVGGSGADLFIINNPADKITNLNANDTVEVLTNGFTLPANVVNAQLGGSANLSVTGNASADTITANSGNDTLIAGSHVATLVGGYGNDTFVVNNVSDVIQDYYGYTSANVVDSSVNYTAPSYVDTLVLTGTAALKAWANSDNDTLVSNSGKDTLFGDYGNDTFVVNNALDVVQDSSSSSTNTIDASVSYTLPTYVDNLILTGSGALVGTGNADTKDSIVGNAGTDTLIAGSSNDTLVAGQGVDTLEGFGADFYVVNNPADVVSVTSSSTGTVYSSVSYTLSANLRELILTGSANLAGTALGSSSIVGNAGNDTLYGGPGFTVLDAGSGIDTLVAGVGSATTFMINNAADVLENISANDKLDTSVSYTLPAGMDELVLTGDNIVGTGNSDANNTLLIGNIDSDVTNDTLVAGSAITQLDGGDGNNTFVVNNSADTVYANADAGKNVVVSSVSYTVPQYVTALILTGSGNLVATGNTSADSIVGNAGSDTLKAGKGNDTLVAGTGPATLIGGVGNETFVINSSTDLIQDTVTGEHNKLLSSVSVTLPTNLSTLTLTGTAALVGAANAADDALTGNAGADTLVAGAGNDTLTAGSGLATLEGGTGNDTFVVNNSADVIQSAPSGKANVLLSSASYTAPTNINVLTLTGFANISATANAVADTLTGGGGNDTLVAGGGTDTLIGGAGNTTFVVNNTADLVTDSSSTANNAITSSVSYTLPTNVNTLTFTGTAALTGAANAGADTLVSNTGADTLYGGSGDETFIINSSTVVVVDTAALATNVAQADVNYTLTDNVNTLVLTSTAALTGAANAGADTLISNSAVDTLIGGAGDDTFVVNNSADVITDTASTASNAVVASVSYSLPSNVNSLTLTNSSALVAIGNAGADTLIANSGADTLVAGAGVATLVGGAGADTFVVNNSADVIQTGADAADSTVDSSASYSLPTNVESFILTGSANVTAVANDQNDTIMSNAGVDTLIAGAGNDLFIVNNSADVLENLTSTDTVVASVSYTLPSPGAYLQLTGTAALSAAGNDQNDTLVANSGNDTLTAGSGTATMEGGAGNDTFIVNSPYDVIQDAYSSGSNTVLSSASSYALPANVDTLTLTGSGNLTAYGNTDAANVLTANSGRDDLVGEAYADTINGGSGSDIISAGPGANLIYSGNGGSSSLPTYAYGSASGTSASTQSTIYGGTGDNVLYGGPGANTIYGGSGTTTIYTGAGENLIYVGSGGTTGTPTDVAGSSNGQSSSTTSTIYGGSGTDFIQGDPGTDVIYAGTGVDTLQAGSGASSLYGGAGDLLEDFTSGHDLLQAAAGAETLEGYGGDTLTAGTGADLLYDQYNSAVGSLYQFGVGFGHDTIGNGAASQNELASSQNDTISFGSGIASTSLSLSESIVGIYYSDYSIALTINDGSSSIVIGGGLRPGVLNTIQFAGGSSETLTQLMQAQGPGSLTVQNGGLVSVLNTLNNQAITDPGTDWAIWSFGNQALITTGGAEVYAYGNNDTIVAPDAWVTGSADLITDTAGVGGATLAGASDTLIASSSNESIAAYQSSDVIQVGAGYSGDSITAYANYTLPTNAQALTLASSVSSVSGASNSQGGILTAAGNYDTLTGGPGADTLIAQGTHDVLVGGSGQETYVLNDPTDTIQFGSGNASLNAVQSKSSYTLNGSANTLTITGQYAAGVGNSANDSLVATAFADTLTAGSGNDTLVASSSANDATLVGGTGSDTFIVNNSYTTIVDAAPGTGTAIQSAVNYTLPSNINALILTGSGISGSGNSSNDTLSANGNGDTLVAGTGNDTLAGTTGAATTFVFNSGFKSDQITNPGTGSVIAFGSGITQSSLTFSAALGTSGAGPSLVIAGDGGAVTIAGGLVPGAISGVSFGGGSPVSVPQLFSARVTVAGASGNLIASFANNDSVTGGTGHDTIVAWGNGDTLSAGTGGAYIYAGGSNDKATGSAANDTLAAMGSTDTLIGGTGNESFLVSGSGTAVQASASGNNVAVSSVSYSLPANVNVLTLTGSSAIQGTGNAANDSLTAGAGYDTLISGSGVDTMIGGSGGTNFVVNNSSDVVQVSGFNARNVVVASVNYTLPANIGGLALTAAGISGTGNNLDEYLTADAADDTLVAGSGSDTLTAESYGTVLQAGTGRDLLQSEDGYSSLVSGPGVDTLIGGGSGYDNFYVNNQADVLEGIHSGDQVSTALNITIPSGAVSFNSLYTVYLTGSANLSFTDNASARASVYANAGNDSIAVSGAGSTFWGGSGVDTFVASGGYDVFIITNASDVISGAPTGSQDSVSSSVNYSLPANIDELQLASTSAVVGIGNSDNDTLSGESYDGPITLIGGSGSDDIIAGFGDATLVAGSGADTLIPYDGTDVLVFNSGFGNDVVTPDTFGVTQAPVIEFGPGITSATLTASAGLDTNGQAALVVAGGSGAVTLDGALSGLPYTFSFNGGPTLTLAQFLSQVHTVTSSVVGAHGNAVLEATASTSISGGTGNDTIDAAATGDTVAGGSGNQLLEALGTSDSIVGGSASDTLIAAGSNDTLVGGGVADTMEGQTSGAVTFVVDNSADVITLPSTPSATTVLASASYSLPTNVNSLTFTGTAALKGTANSGTDVLTANTGADTLVGGSGADTLISGTTGNDSLVGGTGNDLFVVSVAGDIVSVGSTHGADTIQSSVSYTAAANVATLILSGSANIAGTGNTLTNVLQITGTGADTLTAGSGVATLVGGSGNDTFVINSASDVVQDTYTTTSNTLNSSVAYSLPTNVNSLVLTGTAALKGTANSSADLLTANTGADTLVAGSGADTLVAGTTGADSLVGGTGTDVFEVNNTADKVSVASAGNDTLQSSVSYTLPANVPYLMLTGTAALAATGNTATNLIIGNTGADTLTGGTGISALEGGTAGSDQIKAISNQAALIAGGGSSTLTGGAYKDFFAAGHVSDSITTGATANVIAINKGDGTDTVNPVTSSTDVLSLGAGIDTESLYFTKSGNNLVLTDGVTGDSVTFTNWYVGSADQDVNTLQVVEIASSSYNSSGTDNLRNKALEEFNFKTLVTLFNNAGNPSNWALSNGMPSAALTSSATAAYGGDLAYYFGLNGNLTGVNLSAVQSTLTNASYATGTQTIDSFSGISGGPVKLLHVARPGGTASAASTSTPIDTTASVTDAAASSAATSSLSDALAASDIRVPKAVDHVPTLPGDDSAAVTSTASSSSTAAAAAGPTPVAVDRGPMLMRGSGSGATQSSTTSFTAPANVALMHVPILSQQTADDNVSRQIATYLRWSQMHSAMSAAPASAAGAELEMSGMNVDATGLSMAALNSTPLQRVEASMLRNRTGEAGR